MPWGLGLPSLSEQGMKMAQEGMRGSLITLSGNTTDHISCTYRAPVNNSAREIGDRAITLFFFSYLLFTKRKYVFSGKHFRTATCRHLKSFSSSKVLIQFGCVYAETSVFKPQAAGDLQFTSGEQLSYTLSSQPA